MPRGGARPNAGRKRIEKPPPVTDKNAAARLIEALNSLSPDPKTWDSSATPEVRGWAPFWFSPAQGLDARKYLYDKRDGKAVHTVNHIHDKPIEMNVNVSMAEIIREVRHRKQEYERTRK